MVGGRVSSSSSSSSSSSRLQRSALSPISPALEHANHDVVHIRRRISSPTTHQPVVPSADNTMFIHNIRSQLTNSWLYVPFLFSVMEHNNYTTPSIMQRTIAIVNSCFSQRTQADGTVVTWNGLAEQMRNLYVMYILQPSGLGLQQLREAFISDNGNYIDASYQELLLGDVTTAQTFMNTIVPRMTTSQRDNPRGKIMINVATLSLSEDARRHIFRVPIYEIVKQLINARNDILRHQ